MNLQLSLSSRLSPYVIQVILGGVSVVGTIPALVHVFKIDILNLLTEVLASY